MAAGPSGRARRARGIFLSRSFSLRDGASGVLLSGKRDPRKQIRGAHQIVLHSPIDASLYKKSYRSVRGKPIDGSDD